MISIPQLYESGAPTGSSVYITNLGLDVSRKFLNESFAYANVYSFNFEGNIFDTGFADDKLSVTLENKIKEVASSGKFNYRVKSLSFPNSNGDLSENIRFSKFNMSVEFQEKIDDYDRFTGYTGGTGFENLMPKMIETSGEFIQDFSETFSFDETEAGEGKFSHSINLTLLPFDVKGTGTGSGNINGFGGEDPGSGSGNAMDTLIKNNYLRNAAQSIVTGFTNYYNFVNISQLFTGRGFYFNSNFFRQHTGRMTHSETVDLFANTYSLTRSKTYYTGYHQDYCFDHNYNLNVDTNGVVEISEETKMEGENDYVHLLNKFNTEIEDNASVSSFTNNGNLFTNVKKSHARCSQFLNTYHKFLRLRSGESQNAQYFSDYTNSTSLYSLRPIPVEKTLTAIPELPALTYTVKYTTNPNINFGYESTEVVKAETNRGIFDVTYDATVKAFNFQTGDLNSFNSQFGSKVGVTNFASYINHATNGVIKKSSAFVHDLINGGQALNLRKLKSTALATPLALVKKSSSISRRGKDFSISLSYSSDDKYAPLYYKQDPLSAGVSTAPPREKMFQNLIIPAGSHGFLADNFTFIDKKVNITVPQEKFTQRIVLARPQGVAIIDPSVQSSTGKLSISFTFKVKKANPINGAFYNFYENNTVSIFNGTDKYGERIRNLILVLFDPANSSFSPIFHATVNSEISRLMDVSSNIHKINGYVPISMSYKFDSDFNLEINVEVEFYSKSSGGQRKPIFGFHGNQNYGGTVNNVKDLFGQTTSYQ